MGKRAPYPSASHDSAHNSPNGLRYPYRQRADKLLRPTKTQNSRPDQVSVSGVTFRPSRRRLIPSMHRVVTVSIGNPNRSATREMDRCSR
jgi:hypothetical protein